MSKISTSRYPYFSDLDPFQTPGVFYTCFYNHARRLRLEKLLYLELSRSSSGYFKSILNLGCRFAPETAARRFQKWNGSYVTISEVKRLQIYNGYMQIYNKCPFGCSGYVTAVAARQSKRFYSGSGVGIFNWYYLSSSPQVLRPPVVRLESGGLIYYYIS